MIHLPFFQQQAVAGKIGEGTAAVLFEFRDGAPQDAVGRVQPLDERRRQPQRLIAVKQSLHGLRRPLFPAVTAGPVVQGPPNVVRLFALCRRPQHDRQPRQGRRQGRNELGLTSSFDHPRFMADSIDIALFFYLPNPRRRLHRPAVVAGQNIRQVQLLSGPAGSQIKEEFFLERTEPAVRAEPDAQGLQLPPFGVVQHAFFARALGEHAVVQAA